MEVSNRMLRGGPSMHMPNNGRFRLHLMSDERKAISGGTFVRFSWGAEDSNQSNSYTLFMTFRPLNTLSISLYPSYSHNRDELQYVSQTSMDNDPRYVFGSIDQKVLSMSLRINFNITPDLTIQYWGQPFTASGDYSEFKMITDPGADRYRDRFHVYSDEQISLDEGSYLIDENLDSNVDYSFGDPDFTVNEWLSNLVIRWEFLPGSTAYLVWSQTRNQYHQDGHFDAWENMDLMFTESSPTNVFLVKFSYRFGLR